MSDGRQWQVRAACRLDPSRMWDEERVLEAKQLCSVCPVLTACAAWEATLDEFVPGVIAGRDDNERANSRKLCARCQKAIAPTRASSYCRPCKTIINRKAWEATKESRGARQCPLCHDWFTVTHGNARFCSEDHRIRFYREQAQAKRRGHIPTASARVLESQYG